MMSNTIGTIMRVFLLFVLLAGGWFLAVTALYTVTSLILGSSFNWNHVALLFGAVVIGRMFYPRNIFAW